MRSPAVLLLFGFIALAQDSPRVLEGSVVNSVTGAGIEGAKITLMSRGKGGIKDLVTDATGYFYVSGLTPGDYIVFVQKTGYSARRPFFLVRRTLRCTSMPHRILGACASNLSRQQLSAGAYSA